MQTKCWFSSNDEVYIFYTGSHVQHLCQACGQCVYLVHEPDWMSLGGLYLVAPPNGCHGGSIFSGTP